MARVKVLVAVSTYPLPSSSYDELVCTAGFREDGSWIRIYPVPFKFLSHRKYQWVELDLVPRDPSQDFRPESYRPAQVDLSDLKALDIVDTSQNWLRRKELCLQKVYTNTTQLIEDSKAPKNVSLAAFKPASIQRFIIEDDDREWKPAWLAQLQQLDLFTTGEDSSARAPRVPIEKIPYRFKYQFIDDEGRSSTMTIEDWEIGALYRNCLRNAEGDEALALKKVREKYETDFIQKKEITLFLGTTLIHHKKRYSNPFTIVVVFYPPISAQSSLF